ncbi:ATP-grasp domain-containing protein [Streptomyces sp. NPDC002855]|uniref:carboxylate--amine ligase n=1 Tax=Streptomyces sp. NPDC002855 TaxID=3154437 RepID=UPI00331A7339
MLTLDTRVPAVLLRIDRNPFHHGTLGAVRSLGRAGVEVHVAAADSAESPVRRSRYLHQTHPPPPPGASLQEIALVLRRISHRVARPSVLIPMDDAGALAIGRLQRELADVYLLPDQAVGLAERVADKATLAQVCASAGIPHPVTLQPESAAQTASAVRQLGLPVVAKWSRPWLVPAGTDLRSTVLVRSAKEAQELYRRSDEAGSRLLLQAFLPDGPGRDWFVHGYVDRTGAVRGGGSGRKHRSWPRGAGLTAVGEWTPDPGLRAGVERLVDTLGYRGIFDLDFRVDSATGEHCLLDFNPRPGAQFRLFADGADLDVVRAQHLDMTHRPLPAAAVLPGRAFVVENYSPLAALRVLLTAGPASTASRRRELAWHAQDDMAPALAMWVLWCRHVTRRLLGRMRRTVRPTGPPGEEVRVRMVRQAGAPEGSGRADAARIDDERASSC